MSWYEIIINICMHIISNYSIYVFLSYFNFFLPAFLEKLADKEYLWFFLLLTNIVEKCWRKFFFAPFIEIFFRQKKLFSKNHLKLVQKKCIKFGAKKYFWFKFVDIFCIFFLVCFGWFKKKIIFEKIIARKLQEKW